MIETLFQPADAGLISVYDKIGTIAGSTVLQNVSSNTAGKVKVEISNGKLGIQGFIDANSYLLIQLNTSGTLLAQGVHNGVAKWGYNVNNGGFAW